MRAQSCFPVSRCPDTIFFRSACLGTNPHLTEFAVTNRSGWAHWPVRDSREQAAPWRPSNSALSGRDRHDFAVSQGLDIANWGLAKESPVLAIELARAFVADLERRSCRVQSTREHALPRGMQAKLLLKLQRTHRRKGAKMLVQRRSTHACNRCQVLHTKRLLVV